MKRKKAKSSKGRSIEIQLKGIELLRNHLQIPTSETTNHSSLNFNINIENKADALNKHLFAIVHVEILNENKSQVMGAISVSCIFELKNFDELIEIESEGKLILEQPLADIVNSISISTTRGVMFASFKGTHLHNAFLPIIDPVPFKRLQ